MLRPKIITAVIESADPEVREALMIMAMRATNEQIAAAKCVSPLIGSRAYFNDLTSWLFYVVSITTCNDIRNMKCSQRFLLPKKTCKVS